MKRPRTRESAHGALLRTSGAGNAQIRETARDVANLRSSQYKRLLFSIAIPSHSNGNERNAKNNAIHAIMTNECQ
jgi:hypothetical protein